MKFMKKVCIASLLGLLSFNSANAAQVDVNSATAEQISENLKGIGMAKAQRIVEYCQKNACAKPEDLINVKGIGEKTIEKNRENLIFAETKIEKAQ